MPNDQVSKDEDDSLKRLRLFLFIICIVFISDLVNAIWKRIGEPVNHVSDLKVNVNQDGPERILLLPGIGPVILSRILTLRDSEPFHDDADFEERVKGIGPTFIANFKNHLEYSLHEGKADSETAGAQP
jgi:hypothetical protein